MSVAVLITDESQVDDMVDWGKFFAQSETAELIALVLNKKTGNREWVQIDSSNYKSKNGNAPLVSAISDRLFAEPTQKTNDPSDSNDEDQPAQQSSTTASIRILNDRQPEWALVDEVASLDIQLLILPEISVGKAASLSESWVRSLYRQTTCETMQIGARYPVPERPIRTLVVANGGADDSTAVRRGLKISEQSGGSITVSFFQPNIDDVALDVGKKILSGIVENAVGQKSSIVHQQILLASNSSQGLKQIDLESFDIVISGSRNIRQSTKFLSNASLRKEDQKLCLATVRKPIPLASRFVNKIQEWIEGFIPQLKRSQRIELVQRIQSSSKWDFDFGILICLSTLIAALGLVRNSASVVIGAMLVAPLMTPIVGVGLGLAQSNVRLVKNSLRTVFRGFATAFVIGVLIGFATMPDMSTEMLSRGSPNTLDLVVALVSGIAAAYALGRPNLLSALPGVAIAAALVPPLAVSGMAISQAEFHLSYGALLLFCTNIVAIILGTAVTFWMVGIRQNQSESRGQVWPLWLFLVIVLLSIGLTVMMTLNNLPPD